MFCIAATAPEKRDHLRYCKALFARTFSYRIIGYRPPKNEMTFDTAKPSLRGLFRIG